MQKLKKEGKVYCYHEVNELGDYIKDDVRYEVNVNKEVYAPDNADLSMYKEASSKEAYVNKYMRSFECKPLTEEERKAIYNKHEEDRKKQEEVNK